MPRHDLAIYAPGAASYYDRAATAAGGGAERQTVLLARSLSQRGFRVAHIVHPVREAMADPAAPVTLVEQPRPDEFGTLRAFAAETARVWRVLNEADPALTVFRGASGAVGIGAAWSRLHRRRLVFASANNSDFGTGPFHGPRDPRGWAFSAGIGRTDALVVQTIEQVELARKRFPHLVPQRIDSFVEPAPPAVDAGEAFLWISRVADYKRPLLYADLAAALPEARFWMIPGAPVGPGEEVTLAALRRRSADLPNLELLPQRPHAMLQALIGRAVAMVNTSSFEGMPNTWLEGWARGVPALTFSFDPDGRIADHGLGVSAQGSWEAFVGGARALWHQRADRHHHGPVVRAHVTDVNGEQVAEAWARMLQRLGARPHDH